MKAQNYFDLVGSYLDGELEPDQLQQFEQELERNPDLRQELGFHKELIEGIRANRMSELKARLDNVPVSGGGLSGGAIGKYIAGAVIVGGIGYGVVVLTDSPDSDLVPMETTTEQVTEAVEEPQPLVTTQPAQEEDAPSTEVTEGNDEANEPTAVNQEQDSEEEAVMPSVPDPLEDFDSDVAAEEELDMPSTELTITEAPVKSNLEVEIITNKRRFDFHYQVVEDKLVLYGGFDEEPYELIEINTDSQQKLYLYFKSNYYAIERDALEIRPLDRINNTNLIQQLEIVRSNNQ